MNSNRHLIELQDGTLVQITPNPDEMIQVSGEIPHVESNLTAIKSVVDNAISPLSESWKFFKDSIEEMELEFSLSFEASGNLFITSSKVSANFLVKVKLKAPMDNDKQ